MQASLTHASASLVIDQGIRLLTGLSAINLKQLALRCGSPFSGSKPVIAKLLVETVQARHSMDSRRVLSIDMGVKNIGVCLAAATPTTKPTIQYWALHSLPSDTKFAYPEFADRALDLVSTLMKTEPTSVVIERQRPRSGGSPSIPNDVLRTNVLEGCVFTALRQGQNVDVESLSPKHVLAYWSEDLEAIKDKPKKRKEKQSAYRLAKKARLRLVQDWMAKPANAPVLFSRDLVQPEGGKRDDLNDSLVQAVTWFEWLANGTLVHEALAKQDPEMLNKLANQRTRSLLL